VLVVAVRDGLSADYWPRNYARRQIRRPAIAVGLPPPPAMARSRQNCACTRPALCMVT